MLATLAALCQESVDGQPVFCKKIVDREMYEKSISLPMTRVWTWRKQRTMKCPHCDREINETATNLPAQPQGSAINLLITVAIIACLAYATYHFLLRGIE